MLRYALFLALLLAYAAAPTQALDPAARGPNLQFSCAPDDASCAVDYARWYLIEGLTAAGMKYTDKYADKAGVCVDPMDPTGQTRGCVLAECPSDTRAYSDITIDGPNETGGVSLGVTCLAAAARRGASPRYAWEAKISHELKWRVELKPYPVIFGGSKPCGTEAGLREFFSAPANRTKERANAFISACWDLGLARRDFVSVEPFKDLDALKALMAARHMAGVPTIYDARTAPPARTRSPIDTILDDSVRNGLIRPDQREDMRRDLERKLPPELKN